MKTLVAYDSAYGNTEQVAKAIAQAIGPEAELVRVQDAGPEGVEDVDLLVVGSPTQGGRPTPAVQAFIKAIPAAGLKGAVAAFDTRISASDSGLPLRLLMRVIGYAAPRIETGLEGRGGRVALASEGFIVAGKEGPLAQGELQRAEEWAKRLVRVATAAGR